MAPEKAIVPTAISIVIGAAFGYVSEMLANALTKKSA
jgi:large-conductance mechanosensitive channel